MRAEIFAVTYRIALSANQQAKLDRTWPNGDPFISYDQIASLLEPLPVEDLDWSTHAGSYFYFTVRGDNREETVAQVIERLERKLGAA